MRNNVESSVWLFLLSCFWCFSAWAQAPLKNAHAHNDYEQDIPLFMALDNGFVSVEADVHLIDDNLYVSHDRPSDLPNTPTLKRLYLDPLAAHIKMNDGYVYAGYDDFFWLMIDIKTPADSTYPALVRLLKQYNAIIHLNTDSNITRKPVKVLLSGNRPIELLLKDDPKVATIDGRQEDLKNDISADLMPMVSMPYHTFLSWNGSGQPDRNEVAKLEHFIDEVHKQNKLVRLWASPDIPEVWQYLLQIGVDLINTDRIEAFRKFMEDQTD